MQKHTCRQDTHRHKQSRKKSIRKQGSLREAFWLKVMDPDLGLELEEGRQSPGETEAGSLLGWVEPEVKTLRQPCLTCSLYKTPGDGVLCSSLRTWARLPSVSRPKWRWKLQPVRNVDLHIRGQGN